MGPRSWSWTRGRAGAAAPASGSGQRSRPCFKIASTCRDRARARRERPGAGGREPECPVPFRQPQDPETGAVALLRVGAVGEERLHEGGGLHPDRRRPGYAPRGTPVPVPLVGQGHVGRDGGVAPPGGAPQMGGHALAALKDLHRARGEADVDHGPHQGMGDRVIVVVDFDMIVDGDLGDLPLAVDEGRRGQRPERGPVQAREQVLAARPVAAHLAGVQLDEKLPDPRVQGRQREEPVVPESGEDPAFGDLHGHFDFGFVAGLAWAGREDDGAVVLRELGVRALQPRLVPAREGDPGLELVRHDGPGHPAQERQEALVAPEPVGQLLGASGFRVGVVRRPQDADEQFDRADLAGRGIDQVGLLPGVVDEDLLPGPMLLAHAEAMAAEPLPVQIAEAGVAVAGGVPLQILEVEEFEGDAGLLALGMEVRTIGDGPPPPGGARRPIEPGVQGIIRQGLDLGPVEAGGPGPEHGSPDGANTDPEALGHRAVRAAQGPLLSENLACVTHG